MFAFFVCKFSIFFSRLCPVNWPPRRKGISGPAKVSVAQRGVAPRWKAARRKQCLNLWRHMGLRRELRSLGESFVGELPAIDLHVCFLLFVPSICILLPMSRTCGKPSSSWSQTSLGCKEKCVSWLLWVDPSWCQPLLCLEQEVWSWRFTRVRRYKLQSSWLTLSRPKSQEWLYCYVRHVPVGGRQWQWGRKIWKAAGESPVSISGVRGRPSQLVSTKPGSSVLLSPNFCVGSRQLVSTRRQAPVWR